MKNTLEIALTKCFICGEDSDIFMNTRLSPTAAKKVEALHGKVVTKAPCTKCEGWMKAGIIILEVDEAKTDDRENPYRTGSLWVVTDEYISRILNDSNLRNYVLKSRMAYLPIEVTTMLGLGRATNGRCDEV